jgi:hypothetical protein
LDIGEDRQERRRKHYIIPIIFTLLEMTLYWLIISIIEIDFNFKNWDFWGRFGFLILSLYSIYKMMKIYKRQKKYKR